MGAQFTANLNPTTNQTSLTDLLRESDFADRFKAKNKSQKSNVSVSTPSTPAPVTDNSTPWTDDAMNSGQDIPFTFGAGYQK